jgi:four helix bundle protein
MSIAHNKARETRYWLRLIKGALLVDDEVRGLIQESDELVRILYAIVESARRSPHGRSRR